jgi:hypothetical protein
MLLARRFWNDPVWSSPARFCGALGKWKEASRKPNRTAGNCSLAAEEQENDIFNPSVMKHFEKIPTDHIGIK